MSNVLVFNSGSATIKFACFVNSQCAFRGVMDSLGPSASGAPQVRIKDQIGNLISDVPPLANNTLEGALRWIFGWLDKKVVLTAVAHRVVHGGDIFFAPVKISTDILQKLEKLIPLAPLHQPQNIFGIQFVEKNFPELLQFAVFDTAFHAQQKKIERLFALPLTYFERGVKRYGFHGISYEYVIERLREIDPTSAARKTIICHLGSGASMCAIDSGKSVATTMAFSALEGLPMGTRCGSLDAGVLLYLLNEEKLSAVELSDLLYKRSGLLGLSGISADMRELLVSHNINAGEAVEYFCYRISRELGSLTAALGGLDALVFTGGIGEHAPQIRARICDLSKWLSIHIDVSANSSGNAQIHTSESAVSVFVVPTDEEQMIFSKTKVLVEKARQSKS